ncbi:MAG: hypothetical protein M3552_19600 [Planctomycetota bacterium]|nr:hypothetical protein [Planctomycetota bacterium]
MRRWAVPVAVVTLLSIHAGLLAYAATRHSPTLNEPGHLVAGLAMWEFLGLYILNRAIAPCWVICDNGAAVISLACRGPTGSEEVASN